MSDINFLENLNPNQIVRNLKYATFIYDDEEQTFTIISRTKGEPTKVVKLNKVYMFALQRFLIRFAQRNWYRRKKVIKKEVKKT